MVPVFNGSLKSWREFQQVLRARATAFWELISAKWHFGALLLLVRCLYERLGKKSLHVVPALYSITPCPLPLFDVLQLSLVLLILQSLSAPLIMFPSSDPVQSNFPRSFHLISCHPLPLSSHPASPSPVCCRVNWLSWRITWFKVGK